jgi:hypothetical protein
MNDKQVTIFIIILALLRTSIDISGENKECYNKHPHIIFVLFLHALIWIFSYIGCFYNSKLMLQIYLLTNVLIPIHWKFNNNRCILTEYVNKKCNFDINHKYDLFLKLKNGFVYATILKVIFISIALTKLARG